MPEPPTLPHFTVPVNALVVGASGGIGQAVVQELLLSPAVERVFGSSRRRLGVSDSRFVPLAMDVTSHESIAAAAAAIKRETESLSLIINCAGLLHDEVLKPEKNLAAVRADAMVKSFEVNALGAVLLAQGMQQLIHPVNHAVLATVSARVGSISDNRLGGWYAYRTAKAAQNMLTRNLSIEMRRRAKGLICVALHPGTVDTRLSKPFQSNVPAGKLFEPARAATQLVAVIGSLGPADNGKFFAWDGSEIPW